MATATTTRTAPIMHAGTWKVDAAHSSVAFSVKHMGIANVRGTFTEFEGTLEVRENLADCRISGTVKVATRVEAIDEESTRVTGNLTMHGVTREIVLEGLTEGTDTDPWGNTRAGVEAVGNLKRSDFDMNFNQALASGNKLVGDKVSILLGRVRRPSVPLSSAAVLDRGRVTPPPARRRRRLAGFPARGSPPIPAPLSHRECSGRDDARPGV